MQSPTCFVTARLSGVLLGVALLIGNAAPAAAAITCSSNSTVKDPFYRGKATSDVYDKRFKESHRIPFLPEHVPQGLATWSNWQHTDDDLLLLASYEDNKKYSLLIGIDAKTGRQMGAARIPFSHVGGIAVFEEQGWAFVSDEQKGKVRKYSLKKLANAISISDKKMVDSEGPDQPVVGSSFLTSHAPTNTLWAGQFKEDTKGGRPLMRSYKVDKNGKLTQQLGLWEVPIKTQGLIVTKDVFIFSTSLGRNNRSNLYVVRRGGDEFDLDTARLFCFRSPSMSEGIAVYGNSMYVAYESGADEYNPRAPRLEDRRVIKPDRPRNIISNLHRASLSSIEELAPRSARSSRPAPIGPDKRKRNR
jgi:hypothetical protein